MFPANSNNPVFLNKGLCLFKMRLENLELQNRVTQNDVRLRVTNSNISIEILLSSYKLDFVKHWISLRVTNSKVKLLLFKFWVTNSNLKNIRLHSNPGWYCKFDSTSVLYHLRVIKRKLVYLFGHLLNQITFTS